MIAINPEPKTQNTFPGGAAESGFQGSGPGPSGDAALHMLDPVEWLRV